MPSSINFANLSGESPSLWALNSWIAIMPRWKSACHALQSAKNKPVDFCLHHKALSIYPVIWSFDWSLEILSHQQGWLLRKNYTPPGSRCFSLVFFLVWTEAGTTQEKGLKVVSTSSYTPRSFFSEFTPEKWWNQKTILSILSYWVLITFQGRTVILREDIHIL